MNLRFVIESSPSPQAETERLFTGGQMSIGRSGDADWQVEDPKMFVSRRHCVISEEGGQVMVTDASSGGLYIDNAANPVGLGNTVPVEVGMRLHMGDFTLRVEAASGAPGPKTSATPSASPSAGRSFFPDDEAPSEPAPPPPERPANLPDPFGLRSDDRHDSRHKEVDRTPRPLDQADPFGLDLRKEAVAQPPQDDDRPGRKFFDETAGEPENPQPASRPDPKIGNDIFGAWERTATPTTAHDTAPSNPPVDPSDPEEDGRSATPVFSHDRSRPSEPARGAASPAAPHPDADLRDALLRGMGLDPAELPTGDPASEMENLGRSMRRLVEGVMLLLRTRAQEKQKVRVAQTIISSADVNPLKFLATPEDALAALIRPRGKGYLGPEEAVEGAFRDLADHQVRTWSALQVALRRMVDKFDPVEIEKQMEDVGLLEALVAGGRNAKLWQIYEDTYRDIAETAEKQFLGDVGADFRDAYENRRKD